MATWDNLKDCLDSLAESKRFARLWWRDDDAVEASPQLAELLTVARATKVTPALAVIPRDQTDSLVEALAASAVDYYVLQHGYAHEDHSDPARGEKKQELATGAGLEKLSRQLVEGRIRLARVFGGRFLPVLVPPWNRIDRELVALLPALGFSGLSTFAGAGGEEALLRIDCHIDLFDWKPRRSFKGEGRLLGEVCALLSGDACEGVGAPALWGVMTHHLYHERDAWRFLTQLFSTLQEHEAVRFADARELFGSGEPERTAPVAEGVS